MIADAVDVVLVTLDWVVLGYFLVVNATLTVLLLSAAWEMRAHRRDVWGENRWRLPGKNTLLGWAGQDGTIRTGNGAKTLGEELANSDAFAQCQAEKVFRTLCFRSPSDGGDRAQVTTSANGFKSGGNLKRVFAEIAAHCAGN